MVGFLKKFLAESARLALGVFICVSVVAGVAYAADLLPPSTNPPTSNQPAPVNAGSMYQEKVGDFYADSIGSTDGFCIGASCITQWPSGSSGSTCQLNTLIREETAGTMGASCVPTTQEAADGWTLVSWDNCSSVRSSDCAGPSYCVYQKIDCTGNITIEPGVVTQSNYAPPYSQGYYGGGGTCFTPDTQITMANGSTKALIDVKVGDVVLSADQYTGEITTSTVTKVWEHVGSYKTLRINDIVVTPEHEFKVSRSGTQVWMSARDIQVGDSLIGASGLIPVSSIIENGTENAVYNLTTVPSHTYFAGGVLVHNIKDTGGGGIDLPL